MKKLISVALTVAIIFGVVAISVAAENEPDMRFAVASDLHYVPPEKELEVNIPYEPVMWNANRRAELSNESGFIIDEFLRQCAEDDSCEFVLVPGDICADGRFIGEHHLDVKAKFEKFEKETGKQIYVINGNHDASDNEKEFKINDFRETYYQFGWEEAIATDENSISYVADLNEKYRLIAVDSCHSTASTEDGMDTDQVMWVVDQAKKAKEDGKYPIVMMHHNLLDHLPIQRLLSRNFIIKWHYSTAELWADNGIKLVFTGHEHCSDTAVYTSLLGNKIYDFTTTSLSMYPLEYRMISMTEQEISYESKSIDSIDINALTSTVDGYTPEQVALMQQGMNDVYGYEFFKAGIKYRLGRDLKLESMDLDTDAIYYDFVAAVVNGLNDNLDMPIYGEGGIKERAAKFGLEIPESDYENLWDLVTEIVAFHYCGSEKFDLYSTEITILLRSVAYLLRTEFAIIGDETIFKLAESFLEDMGIDSASEELMKLAIANFGEVSAVEYALVAIASPIIYSFAYDDDEMDDNNGVIEGYGATDFFGNVENIYANIQRIIDKLVLYINQITTILMKIIA